MITLSQLEPLPVFYQVTVDEAHLDAMGHMNVRWYVGFFDEATWVFMEKVGLTHEFFCKHQVGMFALEQHIRYLNEVRLGHAVSIHTRLLARTVKRLHFMHFMVNEFAQTLAATVEIVATHVDLSVRRTAPFLDETAFRLDAILAEHGQLGWDAPVCGAMSA